MNKIYIVRHGQDQDNANGLLNGHRDTAFNFIYNKKASFDTGNEGFSQMYIILSSFGGGGTKCRRWIEF